MDATSQAEQSQPVERFCPQCGKSTHPLAQPHLSADCKDCGRTVHFIRHGDNGEGIKAEAGERLTIPGNWINFSLTPSPRGKLYRPGLSLLVNQLFVAHMPTDATMAEFLDALEKEYEPLVAKLDAAKGLSLTAEADIAALMKRLEGDKQSRDWYVFSVWLLCGALKGATEDSGAQRAAWAAYVLGTLRGLCIVSEPMFEETLWRGYLANEVVYEAAAAAGNRSPAELEALKKLAPLFKQMDEMMLNALVESGLPIGPKINVKHLPEELLRALAKHELATRERERQEAKQAQKDQREDERLAKKDRREEVELRIKWAMFGAACAGAVATLIAKFA